MKLFRKKLNQIGSAMVQSMALTGFIAMTSYGVMNEAINSAKLPKISRIKDQMNEFKLSVLEAATTPFAYTGCNSSGVNSCQLLLSAFRDFEQQVYGTSCGANPCMIEIVGPVDSDSDGRMDPQLDVSGAVPTLRAQIRYTGVDLNIRTLDVEMEIAREVLQTSQYICTNDNFPLFAGFNADNTLNCRALPTCPAGEYMVDFNPTTFAPNCRSIAPHTRCDADDAVANDEYITSISWNTNLPATNSVQINTTCSQRVDPWDYFNHPYNSVTVVGAGAATSTASTTACTPDGQQIISGVCCSGTAYMSSNNTSSTSYYDNNSMPWGGSITLNLNLPGPVICGAPPATTTTTCQPDGYVQVGIAPSNCCSGSSYYTAPLPCDNGQFVNTCLNLGTYTCGAAPVVSGGNINSCLSPNVEMGPIFMSQDACEAGGDPCASQGRSYLGCPGGSQACCGPASFSCKQAGHRSDGQAGGCQFQITFLDDVDPECCSGSAITCANQPASSNPSSVYNVCN
jgi:hypothetical protein